MSKGLPKAQQVPVSLASRPPPPCIDPVNRYENGLHNPSLRRDKASPLTGNTKGPVGSGMDKKLLVYPVHDGAFQDDGECHRRKGSESFNPSTQVLGFISRH